MAYRTNGRVDPAPRPFIRREGAARACAIVVLDRSSMAVPQRRVLAEGTSRAVGRSRRRVAPVSGDVESEAALLPGGSPKLGGQQQRSNPFASSRPLAGTAAAATATAPPPAGGHHRGHQPPPQHPGANTTTPATGPPPTAAYAPHGSRGGSAHAADGVAATGLLPDPAGDAPAGRDGDGVADDGTRGGDTEPWDRWREEDSPTLAAAGVPYHHHQQHQQAAASAAAAAAAGGGVCPRAPPSTRRVLNPPARPGCSCRGRRTRASVRRPPTRRRRSAPVPPTFGGTPGSSGRSSPSNGQAAARASRRSRRRRRRRRRSIGAVGHVPPISLRGREKYCSGGAWVGPAPEWPKPPPDATIANADVSRVRPRHAPVVTTLREKFEASTPPRPAPGKKSWTASRRRSAACSCS